ncbi:MAG TPA: hypothetical protein GXX39_03655 [Syntrophothermus lipocalidus]|nr:hypothetical protein [Syntrophothermus lipocalidus]
MGSITIFAGGFGSGKSETALNYALKLVRSCEQVVLADLDMVNPYFCSRELEEVLNKNRVKLLAPIERLRFGDVPQVPPEVVGYLGTENEMVLDVGGDEVGAQVLGYLRPYMRDRPYRMFLVINPYRPFARELDAVTELRDALERASRLRFTGIVSIPNLASDTDLEVIISGHERVRAYAQKLNLPVVFLVVEDRFYEAVRVQLSDTEVEPVTLYLRPEWL